MVCPWSLTVNTTPQTLTLGPTITPAKCPDPDLWITTWITTVETPNLFHTSGDNLWNTVMAELFYPA